MKRTLVSIGLAAAVLSVAVFGETKVVAQDFSSIGYNGVMARVLHRQQMKSIYGQDFYDESDAGTGWESSGSANSQPQAAPAPAPQTSQIASLSYQPDPALTQSGLDAFIQQSKEAAPAEYAYQFDQLRQFEAREVYSQIAQQYGLELNNPAHSLGAYNVLVWLIAHNITADADPVAVQAVVARAEQMLSATPAMADASNRQQLDEEMMYKFLVVHGGWQTSYAEGQESFAQYGDTINQLWVQQFGQDLRQLELTQEGLVPR